MKDTENQIEKIQFIPLRNVGEPAGEKLEGEVIYTSDSGNQKIVRTNTHSIHVISNLDNGPGKEKDDEWEIVHTPFDFNDVIKIVETSDALLRVIKSFKI